MTRRRTRLDKKFDLLREKTERGALKAASSNRALNKLASNKLAVLGLAFVTIMILSSVFAPLVTQYDPQKVDLRMMLKPPSADHILGTDKIGRDVFARIIYGGRISILVGLGSALGAALIGWHEYMGKPREVFSNDSMKGTYLGCSFSNKEIIKYLNKIEAKFHTISEEQIFDQIAEYIDAGKVIGWFNGPMEFGPRALGGRTIIGDARSKKMHSLMNLKIKYRESFRPFAPSVLEEDVSSQFDMQSKSPYMLFVASLKEENCIKMKEKEKNLFGIEKLNIVR